MKRAFQKALVAGAVLCFATTTFAADIKLGFVDLKKVFDTYYKTIQANAASEKEAGEIQKELKEMIDTRNRRKDEWQKLVEKANDQAVSPQERDRSKGAADDRLADLKNAQQAIEEYETVTKTKIDEKRRQRTDEIVAEIRTVVDAKAKFGGYSAVLDTSGNSDNHTPVVLFYNGDNDLTALVTKELNAAAPVSAK